MSGDFMMVFGYLMDPWVNISIDYMFTFSFSPLGFLLVSIVWTLYFFYHFFCYYNIITSFSLPSSRSIHKPLLNLFQIYDPSFSLIVATYTYSSVYSYVFLSMNCLARIMLTIWYWMMNLSVLLPERRFLLYCGCPSCSEFFVYAWAWWAFLHPVWPAHWCYPWSAHVWTVMLVRLCGCSFLYY